MQTSLGAGLKVGRVRVRQRRHVTSDVQGLQRSMVNKSGPKSRMNAAVELERKMLQADEVDEARSELETEGPDVRRCARKLESTERAIR